MLVGRSYTYMKSRGLMNKKVISAMTVGIAAMMALQAPMVACAEDTPGSDPGNGTGEQGVAQNVNTSAPTDGSITQTSQQEPTFEEAVDAAEKQADVAYAACIDQGTSASAPAVTSGGATAEVQLGGADKEVKEAAKIILNGDAENNVPAAGSESATSNNAKTATDNLIKAADLVLNGDDGLDENGNQRFDENGQPVAPTDSAMDQISAAGTAIKNAKSDLEAVEQSEKDAQKAYDETYVKGAKEYQDAKEGEPQNPYDDVTGTFKSAIENVADDDNGAKGIVSTGKNIDDTIKDIDDKSAEFINAIKNAATDEELEAAKKNFDGLMSGDGEALKGLITYYGNLCDKYEKAADKLEAAQKILDAKQSDFEEKQAALEKQGATGTDLANAKKEVGKAADAVEAAQEQVTGLDKALKAVEGVLPKNDAPVTSLEGVRDDWNNKFGTTNNTYAGPRGVMDEILKYYFIPEVLGVKIINDDAAYPVSVNHISRPSGKSSEFNYTVVQYSYYDDNGDIKQGEKYFNWDSIAKINYDNQNLDKNKVSEAGAGIVIYEKSISEIDSTWASKTALERMDEIAKTDTEKKYWRNLGKAEEGPITDPDINNNRARGIQQGMDILYSYTDKDGNRQYVSQFELFGGYPPLVRGTIGTYNSEGDLTDKNNKKIISPVLTEYTREDGTKGFKSVFTGIEYDNLILATKQNQNGLYLGRNANNCLIIGDNATIANVLKDTSSNTYKNVIGPNGNNFHEKKIEKLIADNKKLNDFISANTASNLTKENSQYAAYRKEVDDAVAAIQQADTEIGTLTEAIDCITVNSQRKAKTQLAREVLGVANLSTYLGINVSSNDLTMVQLINELNTMKKDWKQKKANAEAKLDTYEQLKKDAKDAYDTSVERLNPPAPAPGTGDAGTADAPAGAGGGGATTDAPAIAYAAPAVVPAATGALTPGVLAAGGQGQGAAPAANAGGAVLGERRDDTKTSAVKDEVKKAPETPDSNKKNPVTKKPTANIKDNGVALADQIPTAEDGMNWWWLLVVALLGMAGKKMYDEHKKKMEAGKVEIRKD